MSVPAGPQPSEESRTEQVRVRRSPRILNFLLTGGLLGGVVAGILTFAFPGNDEYPPSQVLGFLLVLGVTVGIAVGALVAVILDRALQRRSREVDAVREVTAPPAPREEAQAEPADPDASGPAGPAASGPEGPARS